MLSEKQKVFFSAILGFIFVSVIFDVYQDYKEGTNIAHLSSEIVIAILVLMGVLVLWFKNLFLSNELSNVKNQLIISQEESNKWKEENSQLLKGLSEAIDKQLSAWSLSPSEKDIALLLLKGLSLKEIADIREVSERTVRQQSTSIYQKSNLSGRAELSAFFLEDLLK